MKELSHEIDPHNMIKRNPLVDVCDLPTAEFSGFFVFRKRLSPIIFILFSFRCGIRPTIAASVFNSISRNIVAFHVRPEKKFQGPVCGRHCKWKDVEIVVEELACEHTSDAGNVLVDYAISSDEGGAANHTTYPSHVFGAAFDMMIQEEAFLFVHHQGARRIHAELGPWYECMICVESRTAAMYFDPLFEQTHGKVDGFCRLSNLVTAPGASAKNPNTG